MRQGKEQIPERCSPMRHTVVTTAVGLGTALERMDVWVDR